MKVDLTPMVDLGFLLITFFVFTTTMSETKALRLVMPQDDDKGTETAASSAVTIFAGDKNIWYGEGEILPDKSNLAAISYTNINELRRRLVTLKNKLIKNNGNDDKLMVMIKPLAVSSFDNVVGMLDEMTICQVKRYALMDASENDQLLAAAK